MFQEQHWAGYSKVRMGVLFNTILALQEDSMNHSKQLGAAEFIKMIQLEVQIPLDPDKDDPGSHFGIILVKAWTCWERTCWVCFYVGRNYKCCQQRNLDTKRDEVDRLKKGDRQGYSKYSWFNGQLSCNEGVLYDKYKLSQVFGLYKIEVFQREWLCICFLGTTSAVHEAGRYRFVAVRNWNWKG